MNINNLYQDIEYDMTKPVIKVILDTDFTKEIRILMYQNTSMKEHKTKYPIVIQILEGEIEFGISGEYNHLVKGDIIALDKNIPHDLKAKVNSIIRLTLTKYDDAQRVNNLIK